MNTTYQEKWGTLNVIYNYAKKDIGSTSGIMFMNIKIKDIYMHISDTFDDHFR